MNTSLLTGTIYGKWAEDAVKEIQYKGGTMEEFVQNILETTVSPAFVGKMLDEQACYEVMHSLYNLLMHNQLANFDRNGFSYTIDKPWAIAKDEHLEWVISVTGTELGEHTEWQWRRYLIPIRIRP